MFPLYDSWRISGKKPKIVPFLIGLNILFFLFSLTDLERFIYHFGLIPEKVFQGKTLFTIFSSMFFHAGFSHLLGNMWFLWVFGDNLERKLGKLKFLLFYLLCGILSSFVYLVLASQRDIPAVGASGAISGVLGGYLILFPKHKIISIFPLFFFIEIIAIPAFFFIGVWFLYQILYIGSQTIVAYWAHIGGFLGGMFLIKFFINSPKHYL